MPPEEPRPASPPGAADLPGVRLEVRQGAGRAAEYALAHVDFLVGTVPGCDLRVPGAELPAVLCLVARRPGGVALRKLAPTLPLFLNGKPVTSADLADGDRLSVGAVEITVHVTPGSFMAPPGRAGADSPELQEAVGKFRAQVLRFQREKEQNEKAHEKEATSLAEQARQLDARETLVHQAVAALEADQKRWLQQRQQAEQSLQAARDEHDRAALELQKHKAAAADELIRRQAALQSGEQAQAALEQALGERKAELERQASELAAARQDLANLRRELSENYTQRQDRLNTQQAELQRSEQQLQEWRHQLGAREQQVGAVEQHQHERESELQARVTELAEMVRRVEEERGHVERRGRELGELQADLVNREEALTAVRRELDAGQRQYQADLVRLHRTQGDLEQREAALAAKSTEFAAEAERLERESAELERQVVQCDEWRTRLVDEEERLARQRKEQEAAAAQLDQRTAALEGQQTTLATLRNRLERVRDELRAQQQQLDEQRRQQDEQTQALTRDAQDVQLRTHELEADRRGVEQERQQLSQRSAVLEAAVRQMRQAQDRLTSEEARLRQQAADLDARAARLAEQEGVLESRMAQLAESRERLEIEKNALRERSVALLQGEQAREALQEQLRRRSEELAARQQALQEQADLQTRAVADFEEQKAQVDRDQAATWARLTSLQEELDQKSAELGRQQAELAGFDERYRMQLDQLEQQRRGFGEERAVFHRERQETLERHAQTRAELEALRRDATMLLQQLPEVELRAGAALDRLGHAREQLRDHLGEVHTYVRQCQADLEQLHGRLQADVEALQQQEHSLRRDQDEHRLSMVAFRQHLIDWQGQIAEMKRALARDETRLERKQAQVQEQVRQVDETSQRLARQAEELDQQQREVADRRQEVDRHLVDMREWYRHKLRDLAGVAVVPTPSEPEPVAVVPGEEDALVPTGRHILTLSGPLDEGDQKLGDLLKELQLVEPDTLTALLVEARRQRRSLRQALLASGAVTLYQLALIEAGNVDGLVLGPVRVVDRLRATAHEALYRVFDPRRGAEVLLRHLAEAEMLDAVRPDEYRQRFAQAALGEAHVACTLEVLDIAGRPAVLQEWLTGLPATDWPPLAAAPGVCYRLLTQAALGLAAAHKAGLVHGRITDASLLLGADGNLKLCGLGEPPWLHGPAPDQEPTVRDDLRALGTVASGWCTPAGVRRGARAKPLPEALVSILYRLAADGDTGYASAAALLEDLEKAAGDIPPNAEAWDRLIKYVREHGTPEAGVRQSA